MLCVILVQNCRVRTSDLSLLYISDIHTLLIVHYIKKARYFLIAILIYLSRKILEVHTGCLREECTFLLHIYVIKVCTLRINTSTICNNKTKQCSLKCLKIVGKLQMLTLLNQKTSVYYPSTSPFKKIQNARKNPKKNTIFNLNEKMLITSCLIASVIFACILYFILLGIIVEISSDLQTLKSDLEIIKHQKCNISEISNVAKPVNSTSLPSPTNSTFPSPTD